MAENAAHFTTTLDAKPSIFEIIAQGSLNNTLYPAFQKIALYLASVSPAKCSWLYKHYDEVFACLNGLLQLHYLRTTEASFSEHFYGLKRTNLGASKSYKRISFIFLVVLPYLKRKLNDRLQVYRLENAEGTLPNNANGICKKAFLNLYLSFELMLNAWTILQYLQYMSGQSEYQTPSLRLQKLKLVYAFDPENVVGFWTCLFRGQLSLKEISKGILKNTVQSTLEISAFFVQFLQAWNSEQPNYSFSALPQVEPPPFDNKANDFQGKCALCLQKWKIPTVVPVSGYVYCFSCIVKYLREKQKCPVTNLPAKPLDVIRLYDTE